MPLAPLRLHIVPDRLMAQALHRARAPLHDPQACRAVLAPLFVGADIDAGLPRAIGLARTLPPTRSAIRAAAAAAAEIAVLGAVAGAAVVLWVAPGHPLI